jgi:hypothetical protein
VLLGLTTTNKIGLAGTAVVFIAFALASSFLLPRRWPDYPGRRLGAFLAVTLVLTIAMLAAVEIFAVEEEEPHEGEESPAALVLRSG